MNEDAWKFLRLPLGLYTKANPKPDHKSETRYSPPQIQPSATSVVDDNSCDRILELLAGKKGTWSWEELQKMTSWIEGEK